MANKGGTVVVVGVPAGEVPIPLQTIQDSQIRIQGSATYLPEDYADSMDLLRKGIVTAADFITATRPLSEAAAGVRRRRQRPAHQGAARPCAASTGRLTSGWCEG